MASSDTLGADELGNRVLIVLRHRSLRLIVPGFQHLNGTELIIREHGTGAIVIDGQTVENQRLGFEAAAARNGWRIVAEYVDHGISGARGRGGRPGFGELLKGVGRHEFDVEAAWSVDRLGRSLQDLVTLLGEVHAKSVDLYLHQQGIDTTDSSEQSAIPGDRARSPNSSAR